MDGWKLLTLVVALSLVGPVAVADNDTSEPECYEADDGSTYCEEDHDTNTSGQEHPEGCYEDGNGSYVCEEREPAPEPAECSHDPETGAVTCPLPPECQEDPDRCPLPPECTDNGDGTMTCRPPEDPRHTNHTASERSSGEASCQPHPDRQDAMICEPPEECKGKVGETRACTPPPECSPNGDGTFTCTIPEDTPSRKEAAPAGEPSCRPTDDPREVVCEPPEECEGKIGQTRACTPPPECSPNGDGTFTCRFDGPEGRSPAQGSDPASEDGRQAPSAADEQRRAEARAEIRAAVASAMDGFRSSIADLRQQYQEGKAELQQRYEDGRTELETDYEACMASIADNASRTEQIQQETSCRRDARDGLRELRNRLLAERDLLREKLLGKAEDLQFETCSSLEERVHSILVDHDLYDAELSAIVDVREVGACTSMLLEMGGDGAPNASNWLSTEGDT